MTSIKTALCSYATNQKMKSFKLNHLHFAEEVNGLITFLESWSHKKEKKQNNSNGYYRIKIYFDWAFHTVVHPLTLACDELNDQAAHTVMILKRSRVSSTHMVQTC